MSKKVAGLIVGLFIVVAVVVINFLPSLFNGDGEPKQQQQVQPENVIQEQNQTPPTQQANTGVQQPQQGANQNGDINTQPPTTNNMTQEEVQNSIQKQIQEGIAAELAKMAGQTGAKPEDNTQQKVNEPKESTVDKKEPVEGMQQPIEGNKQVTATPPTTNIVSLPPEDMQSVIFTKTETVEITNKVVRKYSQDGVVSAIYELQTTGSTHPLTIIVNNSAFNSINVGDKLSVTYNVFKTASGETITNVVKVS